MSVFSDIKLLARKDIRHYMLRWVSDEYFNKMNLKVHIEYDSDGKPIVGLALQEEICPIDPLAGIRLLYWVGNLDKSQFLIEKHLAPSLAKALDHADDKQFTKAWGLCPKHATHLTTYLDKMFKEGKCERYEGDEITDLLEDPAQHEYRDHYFYIGKIADAREFLKK